jgi:hypothetical protein
MFSEKDSVIIYRVQIEALLACSSLKDVKAILAMILDRGINGNEVDCPEHLRMTWVMFQQMLDINNAKWQEKRRQSSAAGKASAAKRQHPSTDVNETQHPSTDVNETQHPSTVYVNVNDIHPLSNESVCISAGARTRTHARSSGKVKKIDYPKSAEDVLALAKAINLDMSPEQAEKYYLYRSQRDWEVGTGSGTFKLKAENIPQNMRLWVNGDQAAAAREDATNKKEDEEEYEEEYAGIIGGKYIPRH